MDSYLNMSEWADLEDRDDVVVESEPETAPLGPDEIPF